MISLNQIELVFMPGLDGTGLTYGPLGQAMPQNVPVTVVRYPADQRLTFEELVECAHKQLPLQAELVLIAESFSGPHRGGSCKVLSIADKRHCFLCHLPEICPPLSDQLCRIRTPRVLAAAICT